MRDPTLRDHATYHSTFLTYLYYSRIMLERGSQIPASSSPNHKFSYSTTSRQLFLWSSPPSSPFADMQRARSLSFGSHLPPLGRTLNGDFVFRIQSGSEQSSMRFHHHFISRFTQRSRRFSSILRTRLWFWSLLKSTSGVVCPRVLSFLVALDGVD